jgi:hypothetical protein
MNEFSLKLCTIMLRIHNHGTRYFYSVFGIFLYFVGGLVGVME